MNSILRWLVRKEQQFDQYLVRRMMQLDAERIQKEQDEIEQQKQRLMKEANQRHEKHAEAESMIHDIDAQRAEARRLIFSDDYTKKALGYIWLHLIELEKMDGE